MNIITIPIEKVIAIIKQIRKKSDALDAVPRSEVPVQTFLKYEYNLLSNNVLMLV